MNDRKRVPAPFRMTPAVLHVLLSLADEDAHAYRIMKEIEHRTSGAVVIGPGSLHFTLSKLLDSEMIAESAHRTDSEADDARRKYFRLTQYGRAVLESELGVLTDIIERAQAKNLVPRRGAV